MNRILKFLTVGASMALVTTMFFDQKIVDGKPLNITGRVLNGTIEPEVRRIQTWFGVFASDRYEKNMRYLRRHANCTTTPENCKSQFYY